MSPTSESSDDHQVFSVLSIVNIQVFPYYSRFTEIASFFSESFGGITDRGDRPADALPPIAPDRRPEKTNGLRRQRPLQKRVSGVEDRERTESARRFPGRNPTERDKKRSHPDFPRFFRYHKERINPGKEITGTAFGKIGILD
jgi:hypothetical protein